VGGFAEAGQAASLSEDSQRKWNTWFHQDLISIVMTQEKPLRKRDGMALAAISLNTADNENHR
jgi:hypothetical protein